MPDRDVVDMHDVEAGIDIARHAAARRLDDQPAGRRRLDVAGADRGRRVDDDRRQAALGDQRRDHLPRPRISTACRGRSCRRRGSASPSSAMPPCTMPERRDAAGIDDALDPGARAPPASARGCPRHWRGTSPPGRAPTAGNRRRRETDSGSRRPRAASEARVLERALGDLDRQARRGCGGRCSAAPAPAPAAPPASRARATAEPTNPVAPVTRHKPEGSGIADDLPQLPVNATRRAFAARSDADHRPAAMRPAAGSDSRPPGIGRRPAPRRARVSPTSSPTPPQPSSTGRKLRMPA